MSEWEDLSGSFSASFKFPMMNKYHDKNTSRFCVWRKCEVFLKKEACSFVLVASALYSSLQWGDASDGRPYDPDDCSEAQEVRSPGRRGSPCPGSTVPSFGDGA